MQDGLWEIAKPLIPPSRVRPQGGGTQDTPDETVFAAIIYVLISGCAWRALRPCFGISKSTAHRRFLIWSRAGVWGRLRPRGTGHDPGRLAVDLAVMLADGGEAIADLALLRDQAEVFGPVAFAPTAWRLLAGIDPAALAALRTARTTAREIAWLQTPARRTDTGWGSGRPLNMWFATRHSVTHEVAGVIGALRDGAHRWAWETRRSPLTLGCSAGRRPSGARYSGTTIRASSAPLLLPSDEGSGLIMPASRSVVIERVATT